MVKKSTAIIVSVVLCVVTFAAGVALTGVGGYALLLGSGQLKGPGASATPANGAGVDCSRLDEIRAIYHSDALEDVTDQMLVDGAAKGMAGNSGDDYSTYFTPEEWAEFNRQEEGKYVGIGVSVNVDTKDNLITAVNVYKGSPAEKGGMRVGDKIVKVDDTDVAGMELDAVVKLVRGEAGSQVRVAVLRGDNETVELTFTRAEVVVNRTEWKLLDGGIGYIKILEFNGNAAELFDQAIRELKGQGMKGLVLDLRYNPGGSLDVVAPIADELFPKGPIIQMVNRAGEVEQQIDSKASYLNIPMVVLVNEYSASASELLCGGIQDYKVGTLVGVTTYGKGIAQSFKVFDDGAALRYTADKYLTGGGRSPHKVGIKPDIEVVLDQAVVDNPDLLCTDQDNQYTRALEEIRKMVQ